MPYDIDIVVLSDIPKELGSDIEVIVGLPNKNPWSLPFGHKKLFAERADKYDLFIYTEDDILITEKNISAVSKVTQILPENEIAGFLRYEIEALEQKDNRAVKKYWFPDVHGHFHWVPDSVKSIEKYTFASFTNEHSACYILTNEQLKKAINSGGFVVGLHDGRYDLLCTAATDPYTQCGFTKVICISSLDDFLVHHLSNKHVGKTGLSGDNFQKQVEMLLSRGLDKENKKQLIKTETKWNKSYYEPCRNDILSIIPAEAKNILSVGCGWGLTEAKLVEKGIKVVGIPLDSIIAVCADAKGIKVTTPDFDESIKSLSNERFDCIIFSEILQTLPNPIEILSKYTGLLSADGVIIVSAPNFNYFKRWKDLLSNKFSKRDFDMSGFHFTTEKAIRMWLKEAGIKDVYVVYGVKENYRWYVKLSLGMLKEFLASKLLFVGKPSY
jgi:2-polyprenyl-3-methyl-5-hydroxy-6-metoxy-1,4-benzoquinol methylase